MNTVAFGKFGDLVIVLSLTLLFLHLIHVLLILSIIYVIEELWIKDEQVEVGTCGGDIPFAGEVRRRMDV